MQFCTSSKTRADLLTLLSDIYITLTTPAFKFPLGLRVKSNCR